MLAELQAQIWADTEPPRGFLPPPLLVPDRVRLGQAAATRQALFEVIGQLTRSGRGPTALDIADRLARRDSRRSTALGKGFALPHAHVSGLRAPVAAFLRLDNPIAFEASDGLPVSEVLALLVPRPATALHFDLLEELVRMCSRRATRQRLALCTDPDAVCALFAGWLPAT